MKYQEKNVERLDSRMENFEKKEKHFNLCYLFVLLFWLTTSCFKILSRIVHPILINGMDIPIDTEHNTCRYVCYTIFCDKRSIVS